jgi:hypothetical protein
LSVIAVIVMAVIYACDVVSPWNSPSKIRNRLLKLTPIGSSIANVKSQIKAQNWKQCYEESFKESEISRNLFPGVDGTYAIGVDFGNHSGIPFSYGVDAYWGFDSSVKLIDLKVRVMPNGL